MFGSRSWMIIKIVSGVKEIRVVRIKFEKEK